MARTSRRPVGWARELDRRAENTQLYQVIRVAGVTLTFRSFTATGQLYDAFRLIKENGRPNRFDDLAPGGAMTFTHANTPAYRW